MRAGLLDKLRAPGSLARLDRRGDTLVAGDAVYRIEHGVPVMLPDAAPWSFSSEWEAHFKKGVTRTWGWTVEERVGMFFNETRTDRDSIRGLWILDAGCGNGMLSEALSECGANVVGMDYSTSVYEAERRRRSPTVHFVRGDLMRAPFADGAFDVIVSNGVLHHTPNTHRTFESVARLVAPGGRFYLWLYSKPPQFLRRHVLYPALDVARNLITRMPRALQASAVEGYARGLRVLHALRGVHRDVTLQEMIISAYDTLTPRWRHYHTPDEVRGWFEAIGFGGAAVTHGDNPHGFGMLALRP